MNDKKFADYDPSLDMLNPNRNYMDKYPDWAQAAEINPAMRAAQAEEPRKMTEDEYLQRELAEATAPMAAKIDSTMRVAQAQEPRKLTEEEYLQRKLEEAMSPMAAETNPTMRVANPDEGIHRSR